MEFLLGFVLGMIVGPMLVYLMIIWLDEGQAADTTSPEDDSFV
jgi:uncharacterized membrane protein YedE/YeeE